MGDIVLTNPLTLPVDRHISAVATRLRIEKYRWTQDEVMVHAVWVDEEGTRLSEIRVSLGDAESRALRNTKVGIEDDGKTIEEMIEKKLRRLVKAKLALEGTTP